MKHHDAAVSGSRRSSMHGCSASAATTTISRVVYIHPTVAALIPTEPQDLHPLE
ncbi:MAG: hypothetical protein ABI321_07480 [Polyangia bacterium]